MPSIGKGVEAIRVWGEAGALGVVYTTRRADAGRAARVPEEVPGHIEAGHRHCEGTLRTTAERRLMRRARTDTSGTFVSTWNAVTDTPEEAANLGLRAEMMEQTATIVKERAWTQDEAACRCGVTQPRIHDLLRGRTSRFSLDALVNNASALGRRVHVEIEVA
jgi:predicted XRE-type DNA-binding protein